MKRPLWIALVVLIATPTVATIYQSIADANELNDREEFAKQLAVWIDNSLYCSPTSQHDKEVFEFIFPNKAKTIAEINSKRAILAQKEQQGELTFAETKQYLNARNIVEKNVSFILWSEFDDIDDDTDNNPIIRQCGTNGFNVNRTIRVLNYCEYYVQERVDYGILEVRRGYENRNSFAADDLYFRLKESGQLDDFLRRMETEKIAHLRSVKEHEQKIENLPVTDLVQHQKVTPIRSFVLDVEQFERKVRSSYCTSKNEELTAN